MLGYLQKPFKSIRVIEKLIYRRSGVRTSSLEHQNWTLYLLCNPTWDESNYNCKEFYKVLKTSIKWLCVTECRSNLFYGCIFTFSENLMPCLYFLTHGTIFERQIISFSNKSQTLFIYLWSLCWFIFDVNFRLAWVEDEMFWMDLLKGLVRAFAVGTSFWEEPFSPPCFKNLLWYFYFAG